MCGRFTLANPDLKTLQHLFGFENRLELPPRYNIAPGQDVPAVIDDGDERRAGLLRWGLIPHWSDAQAASWNLINARSETAAVKPSFRFPFRRRRCLVIADGYYEWKTSGADNSNKAVKIPYRVVLNDRSPFAFAGLWDRWDPEDGNPVYSCTILTTRSNDLTQSIHPRMPVILPPGEHGTWLDPDSDIRTLETLCEPYPSEAMEVYQVSTDVNSARNDGPHCIKPVKA